MLATFATIRIWRHLCHRELKPTPPGRELSRPRRRRFARGICAADRLDEPDLRQAPPSNRGRIYSGQADHRCSRLDLERARAYPPAAAVMSSSTAAARLYMYENGRVVDLMRVVAGGPDPIAQTPMMKPRGANPYWNHRPT